MEVLKRVFLLSLLVSGALAASAQQTNAALQKAFRNSYADEAAKNYNAAIKDISPYYTESSYEVNIRMGWLYYLNKDYSTSGQYYQKAVNLRPNSLEAKFGYVQPLALLQSWDKVLEQYLDIIKIAPQNTQANYWVGVIYYNRKQYAIAIKYFKVVTDLYPFDYDSNHMLGWALLMAGRKAEARPYFESALIIKPGDESSNDGLNKCR
jgi:tetratricopeptide (TPR) repeat protein